MSRYGSSSRSYDRSVYDRPPPAPHHDTGSISSPRNHEASSRVYGRSSRTPDSDSGGPRASRPDFGISYGASKSSDLNTGTGDVTSPRSDDVTSPRSGEVTPRSPSRGSSASRERQRDKHIREDQSESSPRRPHTRQRVNSGDSAGSFDSKGEETLFSSYKNRYTEKIVDPNASSSWRRSRKFDDDTLHQGLPVRDRRERIHEGDSGTDGGVSRDRSRSADQHKSREQDKSGVHQNVKVKDRPSSFDDGKGGQTVSERSEAGTDSADDLIFNFRQALHRHLHSEDKKMKNESKSSSERVEKVGSPKDATQGSRKQIKSIHSEGKDAGTKTSASASAAATAEPERDEVKTSASSDKQKHGHKLARQKLVSNDLKAKYIENKQEKTENSEDDKSARKAGHRGKLDPEEERQHMLGMALPEEEELPSLASCKEAYFRATQQRKFERPPSDFPSSMREHSPSRKQMESVPSSEQEGEEEERSVVLEEPTISLRRAREMYSAASERTQQPFGFVPGEPKRETCEPESEAEPRDEPPHVPQREPEPEVPVSVVPRDKSQRKNQRKFQRYTKSKSLELGQLSQNVASEPKPEPAPAAQDDISVGSALTMDEMAQMTRKERIARYKEERRKQLATLTARFGEEGQDGKVEFPSLFLTAAGASPDRDSSPLVRSKSLHQAPEPKADSSSTVSRSKSLKVESSPSESSNPSSPNKGPALSGLQLAELGSLAAEEGSGDKQFNTDNIIDRLQALRKLRSEHLKKEGLSEEELRVKRAAKEPEQRESTPEHLQVSGKPLLLAEKQFERAKKESEQKHQDKDKDSDSGRESSDSHRVRRRLPSLEDVLGTSAAPADKSSTRSGVSSSQHEKPPEAKFHKHVFPHHQAQKQLASQATTRTEPSGRDTKVQRSNSDSEKVKTRQTVPEPAKEVATEYKPVHFDTAEDLSRVDSSTHHPPSVSERESHLQPESSRAREKSQVKKDTDSPSVSSELQRLILQEDAEEEQRREKARQMMLGLETESVAEVGSAASQQGTEDEVKTVSDLKLVSSSFGKYSTTEEDWQADVQKTLTTRIPSPSMKRRDQRPPSSPQSERKQHTKVPSSPRAGRKHVAVSSSRPKETEGLNVYQAQSSQKSPEVKDLKQFVEESERQAGLLQSVVKDSTSREESEFIINQQRQVEQEQAQESYFAKRREELKQQSHKNSVSETARAGGCAGRSDESQEAGHAKDMQTAKPTKISFRDNQALAKQQGTFELGTSYSRPADQVSMGTSYVKPSEPVSMGTPYVKPSEPVSMGTSYVKPSEPVSMGTSYVKPSEPVSMGTSYVKPSEPVSMGTSYVKPSEPVSMGTSHVKPSVPVSMGTSYSKPADQVSMGTSYVKSSEPVSVGTSNVKASEKVSMGTAYTKPTEPFSMGTTYTKQQDPVSLVTSFVKPSEPISMGISDTKPAEPVSMGTSYAKPSEPVSMGTSYTKPTEHVSMGTSYVKQSEPVSMGTSYVKQLEPVSIGTSYAKSSEPVSMGTSYVKPSGPVSMGTSYVKQLEPLSTGTSYAKPAEPISMGTSYSKQAEPVSMGTSYVKPAETISSSKGPSSTKTEESIPFRTEFIDRLSPEPESPSRISSSTLKLSAPEPDRSKIRTISHKESSLESQSKAPPGQPTIEERIKKPAIQESLVGKLTEVKPVGLQQDSQAAKSNSMGLKDRVIATASGQDLEAPPSPRKLSSKVNITPQPAVPRVDPRDVDARATEVQQAGRLTMTRQEPVSPPAPTQTVSTHSTDSTVVTTQVSVSQLSETPQPSPVATATEARAQAMSPSKIEKFLDSLAAKPTPKAPSVVTLSLGSTVAPAPAPAPKPTLTPTPQTAPAMAPKGTPQTVPAMAPKATPQTAPQLAPTPQLAPVPAHAPGPAPKAPAPVAPMLTETAPSSHSSVSTISSAGTADHTDLTTQSARHRVELSTESQSEHEDVGPYFQGLLTPLAVKLEQERLKEESMDPSEREPEPVRKELTLEEELSRKIEKQKEDLQILDTSLDDLLNRNADYLSDMEPPEFSRSRTKEKKKTKRPLSVHDPPVKVKRVLRKKIARSKSEDMSHLKGKLSDSDDDHSTRRSKGTEDIGSKVGSTLLSDIKSVKESLRREHVQAQQAAAAVVKHAGRPHESTETDPQTTSTTSRAVSEVGWPREKEQDQREGQTVVKTMESGPGVQAAAGRTSGQSGEVSGGQSRTGSLQQGDGSSIEQTGSGDFISERIVKQTSSERQSESLISARMKELSQSDSVKLSSGAESIDYPPSQSVQDISSGMASDASDRSDRRRFISHSLEGTKESESSKMATDSDQSVSSSLSESSRKRRKDKSSVRKSKLNESSEDASSPHQSRDSGSDTPRTNRVGVRRVSSSRTARELPRHEERLVQEVSSAISKLTEASEKSRSEPPSKQAEDEVSRSPKRIHRGNNFSQLLQKFSSSDASGSEKSDVEGSPGRRKLMLKRQGAYAVSSSSSSEETRRTPERTQSLRIQGSQTQEAQKESSPVQRAASFKSDFMKRRFSPEPPVHRRQLPATPQQPQSDKPTEELADILNKRSQIVKKQQDEGEAVEKEKIHDGKVEKANRYSAATVEKVIADSEVLRMLQSRRRETDSSTESPVPDATSQPHPQQQQLSSSSSTISSETPQTSVSKDMPSSGKDLQSTGISKLVTQNSGTSEKEVCVTQTNASKEAIDRTVSDTDNVRLVKPVVAEQPTVSQVAVKAPEDKPLQMSSIDTSLDVLETVTEDLGQPDTEDNRRERRLEQILAGVNISSPTEVAQFIHSIESERGTTQVTPRSEDSKLNVDVVKLEKERKEQTAKVQKDVSEKSFPEPVKTETKSVSAEVKQTRLSPEKVHKGESSAVNLETATKSDIMKKLHREITPERTSPQRTGPIKVTSPAHSLSSPGLKRTESVGRSESERPKGILKRTPSLNKPAVNVDPELAMVLRNRRAKHEDMDEEEEIKPKIEAAEDIRRMREAQASQKGDEADEEKKASVAELVFHMQTKIEEVKSAPITPKSWSGATTPHSLKQRSGNITPKGQFSFDETSQSPSAFSGSQLIERLTSLEGRQESLSDKRRKFQQRKQDDWRTRTQPVTLEEIQSADSLLTVQKFRAEVIRKAATKTFEDLQQTTTDPVGRKTEFPQHLRREVRPRGQRHKTLPVTAAELGALPEDNVLEIANTLRKRVDSGPRDSKADSGILSGSDGEYLDRDSELTRSASMVDTISEDDPSKMSVSAKASLFKQMQDKLREKPDKKSASGAKRYIDRKKRERSRTQPVTEDEVHDAAEFADNDNKSQAQKAQLTSVSSAGDSQPGETTAASGEEAADELSRQSLVDKVKLFTATIEAEKVTAKKPVPPPPRRKNRKLASRFATQPVTHEEVEKAAKISPLALSLVKPPDPELLQSLPIQAQRELMAEHARLSLSQPGSRSGSQPGSRSTSVADLREDDKGTLKSDEPVAEPKPAPQKEWENDFSERRGILKSQDFLAELDKKVGKGILKPDENKNFSALKKESEPKGILKHDSAEGEELEAEPEIKGVLKPHKDAGFLEQLKGVLKTDSRGILKKESSGEAGGGPEPHGILKKESSFETRVTEPEKSVLRKSSADMDRPPTMKGILKSSGVGECSESDEDLLTPRTGSESPDESATCQEGSSAASARTERSRRRFNRDRNEEKERYRTQPAELTPDTSSPDSSGRRKIKYGTGRHRTQPITPDEKRDAELKTEMPEIKSTGSIHERLNALKKSGEEEWRKRVSRSIDMDPSLSPPQTPPGVKMRDKSGMSMPRPSSIADRLSLLDSAQAGWKERVGETDVKQFTVAHKIAASGQEISDSPLVSRLRRTPRPDSLSRDSESSESFDLASPSTPTKDSNKIPLPKEVICTDIPVELEEKAKASPLTTIRSVSEEIAPAANVEIPKMDEELESFFNNASNITRISREPGVDVSVDDFNELFLNSGDILETARKIRPKRRHLASSRNPLKAMSVNLEVKTEYTEVVTGVADRELKRIKVDQFSQSSGFAVEALAGLASKENFSKVELRKTDSNGASSNRFDPYLPLMLLHIKGRRHVQCRLVEPTAKSLNSGDCFLLVTPDKLIQWTGEFCNVIEKAKAADVGDFIKQKKDLGCKNALSVAMVEEKRGRIGAGRQFFELLGGHKEYLGCGPPEEDELYENHIVDTNMIFRLEGNKLVPVQEFWGTQPKYEMLQKDEVFVLDFGSELYVWQGKAATPSQRKIGLKLAQQLWDQGYDYSECDINPLSPLLTEEDGGLASKSPSRPPWALFGKVNQNMETILFREKFSDWPDSSRLIKAKGQEEVTTKVDLADLKAYDAKLMVPVDNKPVSMVLEGSHVGRGDRWFEDMEGFVREQNIVTLKVVVWHVLEYDHYEVDEQSFGQFHEGDTYVVRWQYMITTAGAKNLKGQASRHSHLGRERCAYFFWQGKQSTINEKGASALMTVELDEERGPQVRVSEGKEPPCFLNLFDGRMIIHIGKREEEETCTQGDWRFYCLRSEYENEMCLIETAISAASLRSLSSYLCLNVRTGSLMVWHGCKSPSHTRKLAVKAANKLKESCPLEVGLHEGVNISVSEMKEGDESLSFWRALDARIGDRSSYFSLLKNPESFTHTLRLFHMTSVSGVFEVHEILNPSRAPDLYTPFPVFQDDLYKVSQPALFLVDNGHEVFLWQGWWPEGDKEQENVHTGSAITRFTVDRRCAMETTLHYCKEINPENPPPAYLVYAGLEPMSFTNLFPMWSVNETITEINLKFAAMFFDVTDMDEDFTVRLVDQEGKVEGEKVLVEEILQKVTKTRYTFAELQERPLPEGVDPLKLESYLSEEEFEEKIEMSKEEFYQLPAWKQLNVKQKVGLY